MHYSSRLAADMKFLSITISTDFPWISMDIPMSTNAYRAYISPLNFRKIQQCKASTPCPPKTWRRKFPFIIVKKIKIKTHLHWNAILVKYFPTVMKINIILLSLLWPTVESGLRLGYNMSSLCRLSVRNECIVTKRYVLVAGLPWIWNFDPSVGQGEGDFL